MNELAPLEQVFTALREIRAPLITEESDLQGLVAARLTEAGIAHHRERRLSARDRLDFLVSGGIGIECKKGKPNRTNLLAQLHRYCAHAEVTAIIVVVPWQRHLHLPEQVGSKPCALVSLNKLWGVALG